MALQMALQLLLVPPEQVDDLDDEFEKEFSKWKCRESNIDYKKSDYMQYIIGLEAFKKLENLTSRFPQYDLNDNIEKLYC